jgi:hypothetical protein
VRASNELRKLGVFVSPSGVRSIWLRRLLQRPPARPVGASSPRRHCSHRGPGCRSGKEEVRRRGLGRDRNSPSGLSRLTGHVLRRHAERRWPGLPADLRRHLFESGLCQAVHDQNADHHS